jgi:hypothetical protein
LQQSCKNLIYYFQNASWQRLDFDSSVSLAQLMRWQLAFGIQHLQQGHCQPTSDRGLQSQMDPAH